NPDGSFNGIPKTDRARTDPVVRKPDDVDVDVTLDDPVTTQRAPIEQRTTDRMPAANPTPNRLQTVALSEDDLEELRPQTQPGGVKRSSRSSDANKTIQLAAIDIEAMQKAASNDEPISMSAIDIQDLADRAESSGEIEVDVDEEKVEEKAT